MIDMNAGTNLMNGKLEYSRLTLPKMSINLGNNENPDDPLITRERSTLENIKLLFKSKNRRTEVETKLIPRKSFRI